MHNGYNLPKATVFYARTAPEEATLVGYGAIIEAYSLSCPPPNTLALISNKKRHYKKNGWAIYAASYMPANTLYDQLVFALKYEGLNLLILKKLFEQLSEDEAIKLITTNTPKGQYNRRLWFLYEWLLQKQLPIPNADVKIRYTHALDIKLQYGISGFKSARHRVINNLPGTLNFCALIHKTPKLEKYIQQNLAEKNETYLSGLSKTILQRASAFLLLKDSKASFTIEGENPKSKRTARWGQAIGQAGKKDLSVSEFLRLQQVVIENPRLMRMGFRQEGGFIGERDRTTFEPLPDHISAKHEDINELMQGLLDTQDLLLDQEMDAVFAATMIAFGFVFIHPFVDGNGRVHRYLIHHVLAKKQFTKQGFIFPISASILNHIDDYRQILEQYSLPLLDFIEWKKTDKHNVEVTNHTIDYYRYFDATEQATFLYERVEDTIQHIIPEEVEYLSCYDSFKAFVDDNFEIPDNTIALLVNFLEQGNGSLSKRSREKEFAGLKPKEIKRIEKEYQEIFNK